MAFVSKEELKQLIKENPEKEARQIIVELLDRGDTLEGFMPRGLQGEPGTPGRDGRDGEDGLDGRDGKDGRDGRDGYTPRKDVDYSDGKDGKDGKDGERGPAGPPGPMGPAGKDAPIETGDSIIAKINASTSKINSERIDELPVTQVIHAPARERHWGGTSITNIESANENTATVSRQDNGTFLINVLAQGGISRETPDGTVDDVNMTFTVDNEPIFIIVNGGIYPPGFGAFASYSSGTITTAYPVGTGGFIISIYQ